MPKQTTFILIHGAWHASWCWHRVAKGLLLRGHKVLAPDLPGHGQNFQLCSTVGLNDYVSSIIKLITQQSEPVTLVGHSMAGLVISAVAQHLPKMIKELVFIAAYIPQNQQSLFSLAQNHESKNLTPYLIIDEALHEIRLHKAANLTAILFNACHPVDAQKALAKLDAQPLRPFNDLVQVEEHFDYIPKRALVCRHDQALLLSDQVGMSRKVTDNIVYLEACHAAYYSGVQQIIIELLK